jgi:hypothetical protein
MLIIIEKLLTANFVFNFHSLFKRQIRNTKMTDLLQSTTNVPKIPPSTSVHFATRVRRCRVVRLSWSSRFFMQPAHPKCQPTNCLLYPPLFCKLYPSSNPTNKNDGDRSGDSNISTSVTVRNLTHVHWKHFSHTYRYYHLPKQWPFLLNHPVYFQR